MAVGAATDGQDGFTELDGARGVSTFVVGGSTYAIVASYHDDGIQLVSLSSCPASVLRTCADTDADGARDLFACPAGNTGLARAAESVACAGNPCTAAECCTTCADDPGWRYSDQGEVYDCESFVATGPGAAACEEPWATGPDSSGSTAGAYVACPVSCPASATSRGCEDACSGTVYGDGTTCSLLCTLAECASAPRHTDSWCVATLSNSREAGRRSLERSCRLA